MTTQNDNSGVLFKNNKKTAENHPDYTGKATVNGAQKDLAAWIKTAKDGSKFMSIAFKEPYQAAAPQPSVTSDDADDDGLPF